MPKIWVEHPTVLHGTNIDLLPLEEGHFDELISLAADKRIWEFYVGDWSVPDKFKEVYLGSIRKREKGTEYAFVVFHKPAQKIIGSTRFLDINARDRYLEIGGTWLIPEYWATEVNFDCKMALLTHCFETLGTNRVYLKTQHDNIRSRKAIEKIGGVFEGVIRQHMLKDDGTFRSSAYFSILKEEWPEKKLKLSQLLSNKLAQQHNQPITQ